MRTHHAAAGTIPVKTIGKGVGGHAGELHSGVLMRGFEMGSGWQFKKN